MDIRDIIIHHDDCDRGDCRIKEEANESKEDCCQECWGRYTCGNICEIEKLKRRVQDEPEYHAKKLFELAEKYDNWLIWAAAERIKNRY